jgi:hypothetical protein
MSDITKCCGKGCPLKETCHRFIAKESMMWQSYFGRPPFSINKKGHYSCNYYWEIKNTK